jgi:hypothetical protein
VLASLPRPGGLFLDGDHLRLDAAEGPVLARLERVLEEREVQRHSPSGHDVRRRALAAASQKIVFRVSRQTRSSQLVNRVRRMKFRRQGDEKLHIYLR